eukprot:m.2274 g.2274  ORF g.2274 m.2274 type:complete len:814 (+) comp1746_c0_seq2:24-2465(+)
MRVDIAKIVEGGNLRIRGVNKGGINLLLAIDQFRTQGQWASTIESSNSLPSSPVLNAESLRSLILGEVELEQFVSHATSDDHSFSLHIARRYLEEVTSANANQLDVFEAKLLLARISLLSKKMTEAEALLADTVVDSSSIEQLSPRIGAMLARTHLSFANSQPTPKKRYEKLQSCLKICMGSVFVSKKKGGIEETSTSLSLVVDGVVDYFMSSSHDEEEERGIEHDAAIEACRALLSPTIQVPAFARAKLLLCLSNLHTISAFVPITEEPSSTSRSRVPTQFVPSSSEEERVLALLIAEDELIHDEDTSTSRVQELLLQLYEDLYVLLSSQGLFVDLVVVLERGVASTYGSDNRELWMRLGAALERTRQYKQALSVYQQCALDTKRTHRSTACRCFLYAAACALKTQDEHKVKTAREFIEKAEELVSSTQELSQVGKLKMMTWLVVYRGSSDAENQKKALHNAINAADSIPAEFVTAEVHYTLALVHAHAFSTRKALTSVTKCLQLRPTHTNAILLSALLLSASNENKKALALCKKVLTSSPHSTLAIRISANITAQTDGPLHALQAYSIFLPSLLANEQDSSINDPTIIFSPLLSLTGVDGNLQVSLVGGGNRAESTLSVNSLAQSGISAATSGILLDGVGDNASVITSKIFQEDYNNALAQMFVDCARWFGELKQHGDRDLCIQHAASLSPASSCMDEFMGQQAMKEGKYDVALTHLEHAVMLNPQAASAYMGIAQCLHKKGDNDLAEIRVKHALNINPILTEAHRVLAALLAAKDAVEQAGLTLIRALQLDKHTPTLSYHTLPLPFDLHE